MSSDSCIPSGSRWVAWRPCVVKSRFFSFFFSSCSMCCVAISFMALFDGCLRAVCSARSLFFLLSIASHHGVRVECAPLSLTFLCCLLPYVASSHDFFSKLGDLHVAGVGTTLRPVDALLTSAIYPSLLSISEKQSFYFNAYY